MSHGSDEGENYWPGYVDALTSMVQVLAFVMIMLAMAVFSLSKNVAKQAVEVIAKAVNADVKPNADVKQLTQAVMEQVQRLQSANPTIDAGKSAENVAEAPAGRTTSPSDAASVSRVEKLAGMRFSGTRSGASQTPDQAPSDAPRITVSFDDRSFRLAQDGVESLARFVGETKVVEGRQTITINAYAYSGDGALSEARRLAYYRAMTARKQLVEEKVQPDRIRINVHDTADKEKGSTVEMTVSGNGAH